MSTGKGRLGQEDLSYQRMGSRLLNMEPLTHSEEQYILLRIVYWVGMSGDRMEEAERPGRRLLQ